MEFIHEDDGSITARDKETGVASFGDTKAEALVMLAEALTLHEGGGESVTDEDPEAWELDPETKFGEQLPIDEDDERAVGVSDEGQTSRS